MEKQSENTWKKYLMTIAVGLAVSLAIMASGGLFSGELSTEGVILVLSDAFFVPGVVLAGVGLLIFVAGEGGFDIFSYGVKLLVDVCYRNEWQSFHEYKAGKAAKGKKRIGFILLVGLGFLLVASVWTGIFCYLYG